VNNGSNYRTDLYSCGEFGVVVLSELTAPETVAQSVDFTVTIAGGSDYQLKGFFNNAQDFESTRQDGSEGLAGVVYPVGIKKKKKDVPHPRVVKQLKVPVHRSIAPVNRQIPGSIKSGPTLAGLALRKKEEQREAPIVNKEERKEVRVVLPKGKGH